MTLATAAVEAF